MNIITQIYAACRKAQRDLFARPESVALAIKPGYIPPEEVFQSRTDPRANGGGEVALGDERPE
jgi:hypothetical protein